MSMRLLATGATLTCIVFIVGPARAGIYNPAEPGEEARTPKFIDFEKSLFLLKTIAADKVERDNPLRMRYVLMADTAPKSFPRNWSIGQRLSTEAYLIRRRKLDEAINLITPQQSGERGNFLQTSNLAMAYFLAQEPQRAIDILMDAISAWPAGIDSAGALKPVLSEMGWTDIALKFHKDAEKALLKLFRLRLAELRRDGKLKAPESPDNLFDVKFVGDTGKFEPARLAAGERAKLPANSLAIVQQLLIWMPDDPRLYWLLGELYNARAEPGSLTGRTKKEEAADLAAALRIFEELAGYNGLLRVNATKAALEALRSVTLPDADLVDDTKPTGPRRLDWQALAIGFGAGALVAFFGYWQFRELRRRRHRP